MAYLNNPKQYTVIPQNILLDKRLSLRDRGMLVTIISLPDKWNFSTRGLCTLFPDGLTAVTSAVQSLERLGYLKRTQLFGKDGKFTDVRWDIDTDPPHTENPYTADAYTESTSTENPAQYNINTSITKKDNINLSTARAEKRKNAKKRTEKGSFDTDEFYELAKKRSYESNKGDDKK